MEEKRDAYRVKKAISAECSLRQDPYSKAWIPADVANLSETGLCVNAAIRLSPGSLIDVRLNLAHAPEKRLEARAQVVESNQVGDGQFQSRCSFEQLSERDKRLLRTYIAWILVNQGGTPMAYEGTERRKHDRIRANFIVSYRVLDELDNTDITQTKNLGLGGMLLTTSRHFDPGMNLAIEIRLPFERNPIMMIGRVVESIEITRDLIYDTRLQFLAIDENHRSIISKTVSYYLNKTKP